MLDNDRWPVVISWLLLGMLAGLISVRAFPFILSLFALSSPTCSGTSLHGTLHFVFPDLFGDLPTRNSSLCLPRFSRGPPYTVSLIPLNYFLQKSLGQNGRKSVLKK